MLDSFHKYPLFPDLLENQRRSIKFFWEKGILDELELFSTIIGYKKEKTGTGGKPPSVTEPKNYKKKQSFWESGVVHFRGEGAKLPSTKSFSLSKEKFSGTKISISEKTFKKVFQESRNPNDHTNIKQSFSVSSVGKQRINTFFELTKEKKDSKTEGLGFSDAISLRQVKTLFTHPLSLFSSVTRFKNTGCAKKIKKNLKRNKKEIGTRENSDFVQNQAFFVSTKKEQILKFAGCSPEVAAGQTAVSPLDTFKQTSKQLATRPSSEEKNKTVFEKNQFQSRNQDFQGLKKGSFLNKQNDSEYLVLHGSQFLVKAPYYSQSDAIKFQKTYSVGLFLPVSRKHLLEENPEVSKEERIPTAGVELRFRSSSLVGSSQTVIENSKTEKRFWFYFGDIPLMTDRGSFIINGAPRVLVNQIIRCPSVYFKVKLDHKNRRTYIASFLSEYGSWLRLETDRLSTRLWARIDKSPRFPADLLLMGLGYNEQNFVGGIPKISKKETLSKEGRVSPVRPVHKFKSGSEGNSSFSFPPTDGSKTPEIKIKNNFQHEILTAKNFEKSHLNFVTLQHGRKSTLESKAQNESSPFSIFNTEKGLKKSEVQLSSNIAKFEKSDDTERNSGLALQTIWKKCNPGRWTSSLGCYSFFYNKFLNPKRYSIGRVGRLRLNKRLLRNPECSIPTLTPEDILLAFNYLRQLRSSDSLGNTKSTLELDDIDHLKNRRVRLPGEILQNQFRLALSRITYSALRFQTESNAPDSKSNRKVFIGGRGKEESPLTPLHLQMHSQSEKQKFTRKEFLKKELENLRNNSGKQSQERNKLLQPQKFSMRGFPPPPPIPAFQNTLRELFNTGQLSQYMDQTNPLAEITHKRRLSSLGPGGVGRDQAGFAVREIHPSHFGRICPIETPEGQNAGLVGSLASYARINTDGFLQSPGVPIEKNILMGASQKEKFLTQFEQRNSRHKISLFSSELEDEIYVCTADTLNPIFSKKTDWRGKPPTVDFLNSFESATEVGGDSLPDITFPMYFPVRYKQEFLNIKGTDALALTYAPTKLFTGICPIQLISIATSLIPFLEHDDANRALMGSNMQRQAVPFMITEKPFVGTGLELQAARDSSTILLAKESGKVVFVDSNLIQIQGVGKVVQDEKEIFSYPLTNFVPSNQSTSLKQRPAVQLGDWVEKGFLLADGSATKDGEVTLGKNVLLAYMPWEGYNFEDAIVINERLVFEDIYTSIHVERFEVDVKNTKILCLRTPENEEASEYTAAIEGEQNGGAPPLLSPLSPGEYLTSDLDILMLRFDSQPFSKNRSNNQKGPSLKADNTKNGQDKDYENPINSENTNAFRRPESLSHLDERGIVKPGAWVQEGDILVGKVQIGQKESGGGPGGNPASTPGIPSRSELPHELNQYVGNFASSDKNGSLPPPVRSLPFPEYRLLLAIFDLQNNRSTSSNDLQNRAGVPPKDYLLSAEKKLLENEMGERSSLAGAQELNLKSQKAETIVSTPTPAKLENSIFGTGSLHTSHPIRNTSVKVGIGVKGRVLECILDGELIPYRKSKERGGASRVKSPTTTETKSKVSSFERDISKENCSSVSIFLAHKKRIQLGDKMSGRHGNKGIVSLILPPQDMPYLQDGKPVDVVLNPLGVPSRMNVGQVLETLFGLSAFYYKKVYRIMPFDERINPVKKQNTELKNSTLSSTKRTEVSSGQKAETSRSLVYGHLKKLRTQIQTRGGWGLRPPPQEEKSVSDKPMVKGNQLNWLFDPNNPGKTQVFDGRTGEIFYQPALVGYSYMFKLIHLVDDKIHARSTGPYSLVTQQPLGGRSKKGGQRLGEMEVWALQGFGTASILQEFLTVKSDEIYSRNHFLFHLMRRNWDSLDKIPPLKRFDKESMLSRNQSFSTVGERNSGLPSHSANWADSTKQPGFSDTTASVHSKLPESFRVLINELHALCLSVYSNLPN